VNDEYFFVTLYVGATGKSMRFLLDTAASVTWVPELSCAGCKGAPRFERAASHSWREGDGTGLRLVYA